MNARLRIVVADDEPDMQDYFRTILPGLGHEVCGVAGTGRELLELVSSRRPDLVITDIMMPDMDGIDAARAIQRMEGIPVILVSAYHDDALVERAPAETVQAYLVKPIKQSDLEPALSLAMRRAEQFETLRSEAASLKQALEDRKIIERAKGIMMKKTGLDEAAAFRRMQKLASEKNRKLVELARIILTAEEVFDQF